MGGDWACDGGGVGICRDENFDFYYYFKRLGGYFFFLHINIDLDLHLDHDQISIFSEGKSFQYFLKGSPSKIGQKS